LSAALSSGEVVSNTDENYLENFDTRKRRDRLVFFIGWSLFLWYQTRRESKNMAETNVNLNYCGIINLLRQLVQRGVCTEKEAKKIAARIAAQNHVDIILFL